MPKEWRIFHRDYPNGQGHYIIGSEADAKKVARKIYGLNGAYILWKNGCSILDLKLTEQARKMMG